MTCLNTNYMYKYVIIAVIAVILIVSLKFYLPKKISEIKMRRYGKKQEFDTYIKLCAVLGKNRVFKNLFIPVITKEGIFDTELDTLCITRGGIAVIEVKGSKGDISAPPDSEWCQRHGKKVLYFENPYEQNKGHIKALRNELSRRGWSVPLYNYVVFTADHVHLSNSYPWLFVGHDDLKKSIKELNCKDILSVRDIKRISTLLKGYRKSKNIRFSQRSRRKR